jgi:hypothetical protein
MNRKLTFALGLSLCATLTGCEVLSQVLSTIGQLDLLGVIPADGFSDPGSPDYGKVKLALGGRDDLGLPIVPDAADIEVVPDDGSDCEEGEAVVVEGHEEGSFFLLADGSGSVEFDLTCDGCPTDPERIRVEAVKQVATDLETCSGGWRMTLAEFGSDVPTAGFQTTTTLADWSTDGDDLVAAADQLSSWYQTPLWDSLYESLGVLAADADPSSGEEGASGRALVVVSDGADNESSETLDTVIAKALELAIPVHVIAFGPASDSADSPDNEAVVGLRALAEGTGGTYGYVQDVAELPALGAAISGAVCGGYTEIEGTFDEPAPSGDTVTGLVRLKSAPLLAVPFTFRAP